MAGAYEREAFRPNILGRFVDLADEDLIELLSQLYESDLLFCEQLELSQTVAMPHIQLGGRSGSRPARACVQSLKAVGQFMGQPGGPGIAMVSLDGWDSHVSQANFLNTRFDGMDARLAELRSALGPFWDKTSLPQTNSSAPSGACCATISG